MPRPTRLIAPLALIAVATAIAMPSASSAASTTKCRLSITASEHLGPTYVVMPAKSSQAGKPGFLVRGTTCASGKAVIKAFHACRLKKGQTGTGCAKKVRGYTCKDKHKDMIPTQFTGDVTCTKGSARVTHEYTQFTD